MFGYELDLIWLMRMNDLELFCNGYIIPSKLIKDTPRHQILSSEMYYPRGASRPLVLPLTLARVDSKKQQHQQQVFFFFFHLFVCCFVLLYADNWGIIVSDLRKLECWPWTGRAGLSVGVQALLDHWVLRKCRQHWREVYLVLEQSVGLASLDLSNADSEISSGAGKLWEQLCRLFKICGDKWTRNRRYN